LGRIIAEKAFLTTVEKLADLQLLDLKDKYNALMKRNSTLFQRVSQKYIASYLGVSEQSLSGIKKQAIS
jgi:DNA-directed RNA polymerase specialized sigma subunit